VEGQKGRKAVEGRDKWKVVKASGVTAYGAPDGEPCGHIGAFGLEMPSDAWMQASMLQGKQE